ncbi:hypothetical protein [Pontibacter mangrovi]|uniref:Uncharacterized protein n=1 Tax=Pontibacter mangrovi TaxID=2589816 RepID=A0A501WAM1_9BACT|nr:hypothetical protein [Pontibacter mangrovi]TPE42626.1 hypothetical protein FJM65_17590 [Pontibacter mangrovi]
MLKTKKYLISQKQLLGLITLFLLPLYSYAEGGKLIGNALELFAFLIWFLALVSLIMSLIWGKKHSVARVIVYLICGFSLLTWLFSSFLFGRALSTSYNLANIFSIGIMVMTGVRKERKAPPKHT